MIRAAAVVGPTASGKTALAVELALRLNGEIISCDSMQLYRGMDIGTAKPTMDERRGVAHHMIDVISPLDKYSAADYANDVAPLLEDISSRGKLPVFCGGTGLYLESALCDRHAPEISSLPQYREELYRISEAEGAQRLHDILREVDSEAARSIHPNNIKRVVRALEIYKMTGINKTEWDRRSQGYVPKADATVIGLRFENRELLYKRIDDRVDKMIADGLPDEVRRLYTAGMLPQDSTAAQAIGYKELIPFISGKVDLNTAADQIKQATRRYAKRQMTWFGGRDYVRWITVDEGGKLKTFEDIVNIALDIYNKS